QKSFVGIYLEIVTVPNFNRSAKISQANAQVTAAVRSYPYERVSASSSQHSALPPAACCVWSQISPPLSADSRRGSNTVGKLASRIPSGPIDIAYPRPVFWARIIHSPPNRA